MNGQIETSAKTDTIFALSSAPGRAGVAVIRLSGPDAFKAAKTLAGSLPPARRTGLRTLSHDDGPIDEALVLTFAGPKSFTGEDVVEFHAHGSEAVIAALSTALLALGLREARAGEFTRRAVENGRLDLTEAEGIADLIDARTAEQRRQALRQMDGRLSDTASIWREALLDALAQVEGEIDFPDEADVPDALSHAAYPGLSALAESLRQSITRGETGRAVRNGVEIAIIGAPNAGKSTLLNQLVGRDVAITSPIAGTTRDIVEAQIVLAGLPVTVSDTAGLRETQDAIEAEGVRRARRRAEDADLRILIWREADPDRSLLQDGDLVIENVDGAATQEDAINALSGNGIDALLARLDAIIRDRFTGGEPPALTRARHMDCAARALDAVERARANLAIAPELVSEDIRTALRALDELIGAADIEEVFDRIFSRFCIGK